LSDTRSLRAILQAVQPKRIYHLAAATVVAGTTGSVAELIGVNVLGTVNLIDAAEAVPYESLVTTGDSFEYSASIAPLGEDQPCAPDSAHGITKLAATLYAQRVARSRQRPIVTLRLFSTYGPGDNPRRLVPRIIEGALRGTPIRLSRPEITRDWVYIDDVVDLYVEAAESVRTLRGGVFNAGSGTGTPIGEVVDMLLRITASGVVPEWGVFPAPAHDATPWVADMTRTFGALKWRPTISLEDGLRATIAAIAEAPPW
jgi:nucleoside-diphosphate-sugar epimerase